MGNTKVSQTEGMLSDGNGNYTNTQVTPEKDKSEDKSRGNLLSKYVLRITVSKKGL